MIKWEKRGRIKERVVMVNVGQRMVGLQGWSKWQCDSKW